LDFDHVGIGFWDAPEHQRLFFETKLTQRLQVHTHEDWYERTIKDVTDEGGSGLLGRHDSSLQRALETLYPEYSWGFRNKISVNWNQFKEREPVPDPQLGWRVVQNQRAFLEKLTQKLKINTSDDWYQLTVKDIHNHGGLGLLNGYYEGSLHKALEVLYPEIPWEFEFTQRRTKEFWNSVENQRSYFTEYLANRNGDVSWHQISSGIRRSAQFWMCYCNLKARYGQVRTTQSYISLLFPEYSFDGRQGPSPGPQFPLSKGERDVFSYLDSLKLASDWQFNYKHPDLIHSRSGRLMELDFYSPSLQLAIEYQGMQHYLQQGWRSTEPLEGQQMRDEEKRNQCREAGIHLLEIDCRMWLKRSPEEKLSLLIDGLVRAGIGAKLPIPEHVSITASASAHL
jgi:hypothetical protein